MSKFRNPCLQHPGSVLGEVAELAIGMMLSLARNINHIDKSVRLGNGKGMKERASGEQKLHIVGTGTSANLLQSD